MFRRPSQYKDRDPDQYLRDADKRFLFNPDSGIYEPKTSYKKKERKKFKFFSLSAFQWGTLILSAVTLFFLIKYTNYARLQWKEAKRTTDQSVRSADAATTSASTAYEALQDAKNSFQIQNRPYVIVTGNSGTAGFVKGQNTIDMNKVNVTYGNIGKTPAYDAFIFGQFVIERFSKDDPPSRTLITAIEDAFKAIAKDDANIVKYYGEIEKFDLPPEANAPFTTFDLKNGPLSDTDMTALKQTPNTILLLSIGRIHYKAFDRTKSYSTDFCFYYFGTNPLIWHYCPTHNLVR